MKSITILIADDEPEIADLVELHLTKEGYRCVKVSDGWPPCKPFGHNRLIWRFSIL